MFRPLLGVLRCYLICLAFLSCLFVSFFQILATKPANVPMYSDNTCYTDLYKPPTPAPLAQSFAPLPWSGAPQAARRAALFGSATLKMNGTALLSSNTVSALSGVPRKLQVVSVNQRYHVKIRHLPHNRPSVTHDDIANVDLRLQITSPMHTSCVDI